MREQRELHRLVVLCLYVRSQRGIYASHTATVNLFNNRLTPSTGLPRLR